MTSRSRRKPRTTAPPTRRPGTACRLALLAALAAGPAAAQAPPGGPPAVYGSPFPTTVGQPGGVPGGFARPGGQFPQPARVPQPAAQPARPQPAAAPASGTGQAGGLPAGYRAVGGTTPPAAPAAAAGQVMYFHKPADALAVDAPAEGNPGAVALAAAPPAVPGPVTDIPAGVPGYAPPPLPATVPDRPIAVTPPLPLAMPVIQQMPAAPQPTPATPPPAPTKNPAGTPPGAVPSDKTGKQRPEDLPGAKPAADPPPTQPGAGVFPPTDTPQLPPRDKIFLMYDDTTLQKAIVERAKEDARRRATANKNEPPRLEGNWDFPTLPPVVPAGTQYVSRTGTLPPVTGLYEPGFVVHRRLHFEERNTERYGWDLGFATPIVSAAYFYRDVLLWPNSLATGAVTGFWDTSAGKCLPGSPTPYYLYPPGLTITGGVAEGVVVTTLAFVIP